MEMETSTLPAGIVEHVSALQQTPAELRPDVQCLKDAFSRLPSGVVVVTSKSPSGDFSGATVSSFASLSFDPPLISLGLSQRSKTLSAILSHGHFAVHVVAEPQRHIAMRFASDAANKFDAIDYELSPHGVPLLKQFDTCLQCKLEFAQPAGDHQLLIASILRIGLVSRDSAPVAWLQHSFHACERLPAA